MEVVFVVVFRCMTMTMTEVDGDDDGESGGRSKAGGGEEVKE